MRGRQLQSLVSSSGRLELSLADVSVPEPGPDEVLIQVEAAPINPSDLWLLLGPADLDTLQVSGPADRPVVSAQVPQAALTALKARLDQPFPVGNEGAGVVVKAGSSPHAQELLGRTVAVPGGGMYSEFRLARAGDCLVLPPGATAAEGASCFVNPLTALGMVETMRMEGHSALAHTAAASNLGQMLNRICLKDGIGLVNVVRSPEQAQILRDAGAGHVCVTSSPDFMDTLVEAMSATGATVAFDAIGGGPLAGQLLAAMEAAAARGASGAYSRYGSSVHKQVYIYGGLDRRPTEIDRAFGFAWGVGGWLLTPFLQRVGAEGVQRLRARVAAELTTTFASQYADELSLVEALDPQRIRTYARRATGLKHLINPRLRGSA